MLLARDTFELGGMAYWSSIYQVTADAVAKKNGAYGAKSVMGAATRSFGSSAAEAYLRFYFKIVTVHAETIGDTSHILRLTNGSGTLVAGVYAKELDGLGAKGFTVMYRDGGGATPEAAPATPFPIVPGTWYKVVLHVITGAAGRVYLDIDDVNIVDTGAATSVHADPIGKAIMASARAGKDSFALAYYDDIEVATVLTGFNATGVWRYDGRTSTAWEGANWLGGDGGQVTDFPVGYIPSDHISLLIADLVGSPLMTGPTSQVTFNLRTIDDGYHAAALANFIHFANMTYSGMSLVRLDKWKGAALDGEWNTPGNWESWNGSAFIPLLANDMVPAQDGSPWTDDLLYTGTPTSSFTTRSAAYGPNPVRNVLVEASWTGGKILPSQGEGDTPITVIGTLVTYAAVYITTQSIPFAADIHAAGCTFEPGALNPVRLWVGGYMFDDTGISMSLMVSGISVTHSWMGVTVEATTDPPAVGDVRRGVTFENDTKAGTMVPVRRAN